MKSKKKSTKSKKNTAKLIINSNTYQLPIHKATEGNDVVDVTKLYSESGYFTYDPGFTSTAACESKVTYIDGEKGILRYRGIDVSELAEKSDFIEVSNLLIYGDLPNQIQLKKYRKLIVNHTMLNEQLIKFFNGFRRDAHPMAMMVGVMGALSAFYQDSLDINDPHQRMTAARRIIAKAATIGAMSYKYSIGQPFVYPDNKLSYAENFLNMCFSVPSENYKIPKIISKAMDIIFILHADHEQNASTSTVRLAGSSGANPFACIAAGVASLWGPAHGGANQAALEMLETIGNKSNQVRKTPLTYANYEDHYIVAASFSGSDKTPDWFHNLSTYNPYITVDSIRFEATYELIDSQEKDFFWSLLDEVYPTFQMYRQRTSRDIPLIKFSKA